MRFFYLFLPLGLLSCQQATFNPDSMSTHETAFSEQRKKMVAEQIVSRNIRDQRVIRAMEKVPRHLFIPEKNRGVSYEDGPVPIGSGQTISQPYIVALMTESLQLESGQKVLEIGTGSGYQAAILEEMGVETYSVEIVPELAESAQNNLKDAGYGSVKVKIGDGYRGWEKFAPYDAVIVTCAPENIPQPLIDQLKEGGKMVIPVGPQNQIQELVLVRKRNNQITRQLLVPVRFVPMIQGDSLNP